MSERAFAKVLGREPTEAELARLYRMRDAFGLRENDAFWLILIALESYDSLYREYPKILSERMGRILVEAQATLAKTATLEAAKAERVLSEQVARTSVAIAKKLAERPVGLHRITAILAAIVAFGTICTMSGYMLAGGERPFWVEQSHVLSWQTRVVATLVSMPAGWMVFVLMLPGAVQMGRNGWKLSQDADASRPLRIYGWGLLVAAPLGFTACLIALVRLVG